MRLGKPDCLRTSRFRDRQSLVQSKFIRPVAKKTENFPNTMPAVASREVRRMRIGLLLPAGACVVAASATGFVIHLISAEPVASWVARRMAGQSVAPSWDVAIPAALSSIETGIGMTILYALCRSRLRWLGTALSGLIVGLLLLAVMGRLIRQPLMDFIVGNPLDVVLVQNGMGWLTWLATALVTAWCYEAFMARRLAEAAARS